MSTFRNCKRQYQKLHNYSFYPWLPFLFSSISAKKSSYGTNQFAALTLAASTEPNLIASRRFQIAPPKQALSWQHRREACAHVAAAAAGRMEMKFAPVTQISTSAWIPTQNLLDLLFVASTLPELWNITDFTAIFVWKKPRKFRYF